LLRINMLSDREMSESSVMSLGPREPVCYLNRCQ